MVTLNFPDFKDPAVQFDQIKLVFLVKNSTTEKQNLDLYFGQRMEQTIPKLPILNFQNEQTEILNLVERIVKIRIRIR